MAFEKQNLVTVTLLTSLFLSVIIAGTDKPIGYSLALSAASGPKIAVKAICQFASTDIPGSFIASDFEPNTHVGIVVDKNSSLSISHPNPITIIHNDRTDNSGNLSGKLFIHTTDGEYRKYFLHIFANKIGDNIPDNRNQVATASFNIC